MKTPLYLKFEVWLLRNWDTEWRFIAKDLVYIVNPIWASSPFFNSTTFNAHFSKSYFPEMVKNLRSYRKGATYNTFLKSLSNK